MCHSFVLQIVRNLLPLFGFQLVQRLFYLLQFLQHIIVVVRHHGIDEDRVDERHADDTAQYQLQAEIDADELRRHGRTPVICRHAVGNLVPAFHRTYLEHRIDRAKRRLEMLGVGVTEQAAVDQTEDDDDNDLGDALITAYLFFLSFLFCYCSLF